MVQRNKIYDMIEKFRIILNKKLLGTNKATKKTIRSKNKVLNFYLKGGKWPSRLSNNKEERTLAARLENYLCKSSKSFDTEFRKLCMESGRTTNNKRKHNIKQFKQDILNFIKKYGHAPRRYKNATMEGEGNLKHKLDYYVLTKNDMSFLSEVYALDPCHRSGIPMKFRSLINKALGVEKPLIRLV